MIICVCKCVSDSEIESAVGSGATSYESLQCSLGVGTQCGSCSCEVKGILRNAKKNTRTLSSIAESVAIPTYGQTSGVDESLQQTNNI